MLRHEVCPLHPSFTRDKLPTRDLICMMTMPLTMDIHLLSGKGESVPASPTSPEWRTLLLFNGITALDTVLWTELLTSDS